jgi:hypothetical protein
VIVVQTRCRSGEAKRKEYTDFLKSKFKLRVVPVLAEDVRNEFTDSRGAKKNETIRAFGLPQLLEVTVDLLPEAQRKAFIAAQKVVWQKKRSKVSKVSKAHSFFYLYFVPIDRRRPLNQAWTRADKTSARPGSGPNISGPAWPVVEPGQAGLGQAGPQKSLIFLYRKKRNLSHIVYLQLLQLRVHWHVGSVSHKLAW